MSHVHRFYVIPAGDVDGSNTVFILPESPVTGSVRFFVNGLEQFEDVDYAVSGVTITMTVAPREEDRVFVHYEVKT